MTSIFRLPDTKKHLWGLAFFIFTIGLQTVFAQNSPPLTTILDEAQKQTDFYQLNFRDLLAVETKTFEEFNKRGISDQKTVVKSNFLVYQSGKDSKIVSELRNVFEVNGRPIPNGMARAEQFLAELAKTSTLEKELKKIESEGAKYDKSWIIYGVTLNEAVVLAPNLRPFFDFQLVGTEDYQGNEVYVISYQQLRKSPDVNVNSKDLNPNAKGINIDVDIPGSLKKNDIFLRGKLWIDAKTFRIWREEREVTVQANKPLVLLSTVLEYQNSDFEILLPKRILITLNRVNKEKNNVYTASKLSTANFEYSNFRKTDVEIRILDDEEEVKDN